MWCLEHVNVQTYTFLQLAKNIFAYIYISKFAGFGGPFGHGSLGFLMQ